MEKNDYLVIEDIHKSFFGVEVLKGVNLSVAAGEVHGLLGGNCRLPRYLTKPRQRRSEWDMAGSDGISRVSTVFRGKSLLTNKMRII